VVLSSYYLNLDPDNDWICKPNVIVRGGAFVGDNLLSGVSLAKYFDDIDSPSNFDSAIKCLSEFYGIVFAKAGHAYCSSG